MPTCYFCQHATRVTIWPKGLLQPPYLGNLQLYLYTAYRWHYLMLSLTISTSLKGSNIHWVLSGQNWRTVRGFQSKPLVPSELLLNGYFFPTKQHLCKCTSMLRKTCPSSLLSPCMFSAFLKLAILSSKFINALFLTILSFPPLLSDLSSLSDKCISYCCLLPTLTNS